MNNPREQPLREMSNEEINTMLKQIEKTTAKLIIRKKVLEDLLHEKGRKT